MAIRESESQTSGDFSSVFSMALSRSNPNALSCQGTSFGSRWPSFSGRTFWTKYCMLCTLCGSAATILAGIFLVVAALFRYHTTSIYYFETVPTYVPAILLSICGVSTIAFSCKRNRNIILLRITACWSLVSAALSSVITITTSLIHMNRLQTLKECVYNRNPPSCTCFGHSYGIEGLSTGTEPLHFVFENTVDCDVIHGVLYSCLRAVFAISVVAVLLSIFLCMLLYQLIGHERKKAYWSRIRRINSDWSSDFLTCLTRPLPRDRSLLPLMLSNSASLGLGVHGSSSMMSMGIPNQGLQWGPPPPYELSDLEDTRRLLQPTRRASLLCTAPQVPSISQNIIPVIPIPLVTPQVPTSGTTVLSGGHETFTYPHPFTPTITTIVQQEGRATSSTTQAQAFVPRLLLRESKISIESDSENVYSHEDELFQATRVGVLYEPFVQMKSEETWLELPRGENSIARKGNTSLPSSPILTNIKRMIRRRMSGAGNEMLTKMDSKSLPTRSLPGTPIRIQRMRAEEVDVLEKDNDLC